MAKMKHFGTAPKKEEEKESIENLPPEKLMKLALHVGYPKERTPSLLSDDPEIKARAIGELWLIVQIRNLATAGNSWAIMWSLIYLYDWPKDMKG